MPAGPGGYPSGYGHKRELELARLRALEEIADPYSRAALERAGVGAGWSCADVGAGAGSMARWLAAAAGPAGRVVAVDVDTALLESSHGAGVEVCRQDITAGPVPPGGFDLVHARFLLEWLPDPAAALTHLAASARPGGVVMVTDMDWGSRIPGPPAWEAVFGAVPRALTAMSGGAYQPGLGARLPGLLRTAGVTVAGGTTYQTIITPGSPEAPVHRSGDDPGAAGDGQPGHPGRRREHRLAPGRRSAADDVVHPRRDRLGTHTTMTALPSSPSC